MRLRLLHLLSFGLGSLGLASVALAASPHFVNGSAKFGSGNGLVVSFKEAGLGKNAKIDYEARGNATALWACITGGGKNPSASNKRSIETPVTEPGTFTSGKNGSINASMTLDLPTPSEEEFSCPPGQKKKLASVTWDNVKVVDTTNDVTLSLEGPFEKTLITLKE